MPFKKDMGWDASKMRWHRMHKGVMYRVTPAKLREDKSLPAVAAATRDGSREAANEWWRRKLMELEGDPSRVQVLADMTSDGDELRKRHRELGELIAQRDKGVEAVLAETLTFGDGLEFTFDAAAVARNPEVDNLRRIGKPAPAPAERSVGANAERFLAVIRGESKPLTYREIRQCVRALAADLDEEADVSVIDEARVAGFYLKLKAADLSQGTKKKRWGFFRRFAVYLVENKLIAAPGNLHSKSFRFKLNAEAVKTYDLAEVRDVLGKVTSRLRLYAYLGLNCGMTAADVGQLNKDMISGGKLTRKRVKTAAVKTVPTVTYQLWPETLALLDEFRSDHPTLVLTGKSGEALWESRLEDDGRTPQKDMISQQWKRAGVSIPHKAFRSIAATALESHPTYGRYVEHFLGHSPKSVKDRHYAAPSGEVFAEAMAWLRAKILG